MHRWLVYKLGRLMVRVHHFLDVDRTPFHHTHPFHYISIVYWGGYTEEVVDERGIVWTKSWRAPAIIVRRQEVPHRIISLRGGCCRTLIFTWYTGRTWHLRRIPNFTPEGYFNCKDGMYMFSDGFRKRFNGRWYKLYPTINEARDTLVLSIHQNINAGEPTNHFSARRASL